MRRRAMADGLDGCEGSEALKSHRHKAKALSHRSIKRLGGFNKAMNISLQTTEVQLRKAIFCQLHAKHFTSFFNVDSKDWTVRVL